MILAFLNILTISTGQIPFLRKHIVDEFGKWFNWSWLLEWLEIAPICGKNASTRDLCWCIVWSIILSTDPTWYRDNFTFTHLLLPMQWNLHLDVICIAGGVHNWPSHVSHQIQILESPPSWPGTGAIPWLRCVEDTQGQWRIWHGFSLWSWRC